MIKSKVGIYTSLIIILNIPVLFSGVFKVESISELSSFLFFVMLAVLAESLAIEVENMSKVSISSAIGIAAILIFEPTLVGSIMFFGVIFSIYEDGGIVRHLFNSSFYKRLFNASSFSITAFVSALAYQYFTGLKILKFMSFDIIAILITLISYTFINSVIYMKLFSLLSGERFLKMFWKNAWASLNFFAIAPLGIFMALFYNSYGWFAVMLFFGPLLLARYSFKLYLKMKKAYFDTINSLTNALDAKDKYTNGHSRRVADYSVMIARAMHLNELKIERLRTAALLHDIGKIGVSDTIINKPGKLSEEEFHQIEQHPAIGFEIIDGIDFLKDVKDHIRHHHEHFDGTGYPDGLVGEEIPIEAQILAVADAFDAMTTDRPYRRALSEEIAFSILEKNKGVQFSEQVVTTFISIRVKRGSVLIAN